MTAQELKETGQRLFKAGQYSDAIPLLKSAAEAFPKDESLWSELVLAAHHAGQNEQAVDFAKQAIRQHPRSGWLWRQLGCELTTADRLDEAEKAFSNALSFLGPSDEWLWRYLAALHRKQKNFEREIEALENLCELGEANSNDIWQLGNTYYERENYAKAIESYRYQAILSPDPNPFFNMGLVFNKPEVSQDADAADAYRRALFLNPNFNKAREQLEVTKQKLVPLAVKARDTTSGLVQPNEHFQFYVSPFEVLQIETVELVEELDVKVIQRAKKQLLQEIELNDGKVSWMDDYSLDKARALAIVDELDDTAKKRYHWAVFQNKRLLGFLTRGDIRHFLYADDYFPHETLELLDEEPEFRAFLSKPFARQYNLVLTRAIERRLLAVVEVLFDGRRWVEPEDEDVCFKGTLKRVQALVEQMEDMEHQSTETKITGAKIEDFLSRQSVPEIFNLLPTTFDGEKSRIVATMRQIAFACHKEHDDTEQSATILKLCKKFQFKSVDLNKWLEDDAKAIEVILKEKEKQKVFANLKPISWAPSLSTVNGMGFTLHEATLDPILKECERAFTAAERDPTSGVMEAEQLLSVVDNMLVELELRGAPAGIVPRAKDEVAGTVMQCAMAFGNKTKTWQPCIPLLEASLRLVASPPLEEQIRTNLQTARQNEKFGNLKPISSAPSLRTVNGIGFALYGGTDIDAETGSCLATYYFVLLAIPIFPICRYRVSRIEGGYRFFGKAPLRAFDKWHFFIALALLACLIIYIAANTAPSGGSYSSAPRPPTYSQPSAPGVPTSESKTVYRIPTSSIKAELDRDSRLIDSEKAKAELMASQLDNLEREIKQKELYLNRESQLAIDEYNRKVDTYNGLLERARAQNRLVNQLVESYNEKLRKYGR